MSKNLALDHSNLPKKKSDFINWDKKNEFYKVCLDKKNDYYETMKNHKFQSGGIFYSEAFAFLCMCSLFKIDLIIESGMSRGNSTEIFLKNFSGEVITFEISKMPYHDDVEHRLKKFSNLKEIYYKNSSLYIDEVIHKNTDKKIALFIDGPKDLKAVNLLLKSFKNKNVLFGGIHDITNPITKRRPHYGFMKNFGKAHILSTDEEEFRNIYGYIDELVEDHSGTYLYNNLGKIEFNSDKNAIRKRFPKGPGIGIAINPIIKYRHWVITQIFIARNILLLGLYKLLSQLK